MHSHACMERSLEFGQARSQEAGVYLGLDSGLDLRFLHPWHERKALRGDVHLSVSNRQLEMRKVIDNSWKGGYDGPTILSKHGELQQTMMVKSTLKQKSYNFYEFWQFNQGLWTWKLSPKARIQSTTTICDVFKRLLEELFCWQWLSFLPLLQIVVPLPTVLKKMNLNHPGHPVTVSTVSYYQWNSSK